MKKLFFVLATCLVLSSCNDIKKEKKIQHTIGSLVLSAPASMIFVKGKGVDSYVAYLINNKDTFHIEYGSGKIIYNLYEISPHVLNLNDKNKIIKQSGREPSMDEVVFSEYPEEDEGQKIFNKNYFMYDTINGIIVKVVQPKRIGNGITGLYVPKLKDGKSFSIYGVNLDSGNHISMLEIFRTIRYR